MHQLKAQFTLHESALRGIEVQCALPVSALRQLGVQCALPKSALCQIEKCNGPFLKVLCAS